jgi:hypothetical protein
LSRAGSEIVKKYAVRALEAAIRRSAPALNSSCHDVASLIIVLSTRVGVEGQSRTLALLLFVVVGNGGGVGGTICPRSRLGWGDHAGRARGPSTLRARIQLTGVAMSVAWDVMASVRREPHGAMATGKQKGRKPICSTRTPLTATTATKDQTCTYLSLLGSNGKGYYGEEESR